MYKIYTIKYLEPIQYGGDIITYVPEYPNNLGESRSADWPPSINERVSIEDPNSKKVLSGTVIDNLWNGTACVIKLQNQDFTEVSFKDEPRFNYGKGYFLLLPDYYWNSLDKPLNDNQKEEYMDSSDSEKYSLDRGDEINNSRNECDRNRRNNLLMKAPNIESKANLSVKNYEEKQDNERVVSTRLDDKIPSNQELITNNDLYRPLLGRPKKDYFSDIKLDIRISSENDILKSLNKSKVKLLNEKLNNFENIESKDIFIVVNKNIAINNLINDPNDEINEGNKIIKWLEEVLKKKVFTDLVTNIHEGYVYITRKGVKVLDTISKKNVDLKYFTWQDGKPINYHTLKYVIFQNEFQQNLGDNVEQRREAEDILSQEYIIALQPSPLFQLWTLKRLIMIWYSDPNIENIIRKVKVIINQYRSDPEKSYNNKNGILASILIYPKYGVKNTKYLISRLEYYFSLYIDQNSNPRFQDIQWNGSNPSYFLKKNSLMFYTNGSIELKNYIKDSISNSRQDIPTNGLTNDMTEFLESNRVMGV